VSLDTLDAKQYHYVTRRGDIERVLAGIETAQAVGLRPVKINTVVMRGFNEDEVVDFARRTVRDGWNVRFIEVMPLGQGADRARETFVSTDETRARIEDALGQLEPAELPGSGPARVWRVPGSKGTIGFISALSEHFCATCNRIRLTADGRLVPCLHSTTSVDIRSTLRSDASDAEVRQVLEQAIAAKPAAHHLDEVTCGTAFEMSHLGG
jgi:cyclic pyranopterin phosphate synthase